MKTVMKQVPTQYTKPLHCPPCGNSCSLHMYAGRPDNQVETHMPDLETT